jgi:hypothetical protein
MDGRGRAMDNIFVERLWRSVKYEEVYVKDYERMSEAVTNLRNYFLFYNHERVIRPWAIRRRRRSTSASGRPPQETKKGECYRSTDGAIVAILAQNFLVENAQKEKRSKKERKTKACGN